MIVSLFLSMMAFTNTAFPGWFMKASMSVGDGIAFSGLKDGGVLKGSDDACSK